MSCFYLILGLPPNTCNINCQKRGGWRISVAHTDCFKQRYPSQHIYDTVCYQFLIEHSEVKCTMFLVHATVQLWVKGPLFRQTPVMFVSRTYGAKPKLLAGRQTHVCEL